MLLSVLSKFVSTMLVSAVVAAALALLFSQTLLNSRYIEGQLATTNSYDRLSNALVNEIAHDSGTTDPTLKDKLKTVLTPVVLQQKVDLALEQMQAYYDGKGDAPAINVSDLVAKAREAGVPIGSDSGLDKPIKLDPGAQVKGAGQKYDQIKWMAVSVAAVLAGLLVLICWKRRRWVAMPHVLIWIGVQLGIVAAAFKFGPGIAEHYMKFDVTSNAFASIGHDLAITTAHDLGKRLAIVAASYFIVGVTLRIIWGRHHKPQIPKMLRQK